MARHLLTAHGAGLLVAGGLAGASVLLAAIQFGPTIRGLAHVPVVAALACAAVTDLHAHRIPDWCTFPALLWAAGISLLPAAWRPGDAVVGGLVCGGLLLALALMSRGAIGGGDVKLAGLVGVSLGPAGGLWVLFAAHAAAGLYLLPLLFLGKRGRTSPVPFGPFLALPAILAILAELF
jgi:prepilin signal peptidase PulO-like enzyme (type II secretory pathway)